MKKKYPQHHGNSQSTREYATPSSGTSPLASYKEVTPHPPPTPGCHTCTFYIPACTTRRTMINKAVGGGLTEFHHIVKEKTFIDLPKIPPNPFA